MIVYETATSFVMTEQHEHALLSETFAKHWKDELSIYNEKKEDALFAIAQHDRSWIDMDSSPVWNDKSSQPYSFIDFPESIKLSFYTKGLNEIQNSSLYAALICSIHYVNFFDDLEADLRITNFLNHEHQRQKYIKSTIQCDDNGIKFYYDLLKLCDSLSLFVCMQEAGATGNKIHKWFQQGITQPFSFLPENKFQVVWHNQNEISVKSFPFQKDFIVRIPMRFVLKKHIQELGIIEAFAKTPISIRQVRVLDEQ